MMTRRAALVGLAATALSCTSVDPGPNFVVATATFDPNYFYCHVEPQYIFGNAYRCGTGDPSKGDPAGPPYGCHFNASAVTGMALLDHAPVNCGGGDAPVDLTQIGTGSAPQSNYEAVSLEMSAQYTTAPVFVRPGTGVTHPRQIFPTTDPLVNSLLSTWATK
jgi:hypothetical protein